MSASQPPDLGASPAVTSGVRRGPLSTKPRPHRWSQHTMQGGHILWSCTRCPVQAQTPLWVHSPSSATGEAICFRRPSASAPWERYQRTLGIGCTEPEAA